MLSAACHTQCNPRNNQDSGIIHPDSQDNITSRIHTPVLFNSSWVADTSKSLGCLEVRVPWTIIAHGTGGGWRPEPRKLLPHP